MVFPEIIRIRFYHPLDGVTDPKYKLLHFLKTEFFLQREKALAFNQDICCHLALCLRLILFHCLSSSEQILVIANSIPVDPLLMLVWFCTWYWKNLIMPEAGMLNKSLRAAEALGVTRFITIVVLSLSHFVVLT
jgi:hypothetical protein